MREHQQYDDRNSVHFSGLDINLSHTLPEIIDHVARCYGEIPFIIDETGNAINFAEFQRRVWSLSAALIARHIEPGDIVAIWAPNSAEWILTASAIESIGAIMVPLNTRFRGNEAAYILQKTRAAILFTVRSFLGNHYIEMLLGSCGGEGDSTPVSDLPSLQEIVAFDEEGLAAFEAQSVSREMLEQRILAVRPDTIADILFTSGTTGQPKGAMHNHGQALWMVANWNRANDLRAGDRMLVINPFFHSFGYRSGWVSALAAGITVYPVANFNAGQTLRIIEQERISVLMGPPNLFYSLLEHPDRDQFDLSSLRVGHTGSANVPVELIQLAREKLGYDMFLTSFGQTESTAIISVTYPDDSFETIAHSVGRPVPGVELRIVDACGESLPQGEAGELLVRGPNVMQGYFDEPEQTASTIDEDGWLHTGDIGCIGDDGNLRILGRQKDLVIVGGFNAYPAEIENMLRAHPAIEDVAVIGWPEDRLGEVCAACVILGKNSNLTLEELSDWCRSRMANYKVPRHLFIVDEFPRTPLGKVQKFLLRNQLDGRPELATSLL